MKIYRGIILFSVFLIAGCGSVDNGMDYVSAEDLIIYKRNIGSVLNEKESTYKEIVESIRPFEKVLTNTKTINDFEFVASYQPHLFLAIANNDSIELTQVANPSVMKGIKNYNNLHYIKFSLENKKFKSELLRFKIQSQQQYSDRIMYYSFYSNKDVYLLENDTDTIRGAFVHFERTFDVSPKLNMTFVFERKGTTPPDKLNFIFEDVIFNNGKLDFEFDYKTISVLNAPEINKILL